MKCILTRKAEVSIRIFEYVNERQWEPGRPAGRQTGKCLRNGEIRQTGEGRIRSGKGPVCVG